MKNILTVVSVIISISFGCSAGPKNTVSGKWLMHKIIQEGKDVTAEHNPHNERYIVLNTNNSFESSGRPFGENTGKYVFKSEDKTLFIDSDAGPEDDSYWNVTLSNDTMYWQGYGSEWAENFRIVHVKDGEAN